ncbi:MAG: 50S ribosomal protein L6 [Flavobacteriaceae bacterium]|nr:MAG: 50S ribosomal protein L6 [Flavobacteriaceae bacterium]|tara:strand:+ start:33 stop:575 length:543 start_codon:yes stop_codon:yes gene_type:complete
MSRIGNNPIVVPEGVNVEIHSDSVKVSGKLGTLSQNFDGVSVSKEENQLIVKRNSESKEHKAKHGLYRSLIYNMVVGVSQGWKKSLELVGVGYRAQSSGQKLDLSLGFSHNIVMMLPDEIKIETVNEKGKNPIINITSYDKQLVGMVAAKIRSYRKPEPYKGKGVKFVGEEIRRKAGKSA